AVLTETLEFLTLRPGVDGGTWVGRAPGWFGDYLFGGFVIAQAIVAATRDAPQGRRLHSLHAYFLRPVLVAQEISYCVRPVRGGRTAPASRRTGCGSACRPGSPTTSTCTRPCWASPPTGRASAGGPCTWRETPRAWSASTTPPGSTARPGPTNGCSTTCTPSSTPGGAACSEAPCGTPRGG